MMSLSCSQDTTQANINNFQMIEWRRRIEGLLGEDNTNQLCSLFV